MATKFFNSIGFDRKPYQGRTFSPIIGKDVQKNAEEFTLTISDFDGYDSTYAHYFQLYADVAITSPRWINGRWVTASEGRSVRELVANAKMFTYPTYAYYVDLYVSNPARQHGAAKILHSIRDEVARSLGYSHAMCTTNGTNTLHEDMLRKFGWLPLNQWHNGNSGRRCTTWFKPFR